MSGRILKTIILAMSMLAVCLMLGACGVERSEDVADYDKIGLIEDYSKKMDSKLLIFPDSVHAARISAYRMSLNPGILDIKGYVILDCTYDKEYFDLEMQRIKNIVNTVETRGGSHTNPVIYIPAEYYYPAYAAIDGYDDKYEYALINEDNREVVYVYVSNLELGNFYFGKYLKTDRTVYQEKKKDGFSIYE